MRKDQQDVESGLACILVGVMMSRHCVSGRPGVRGQGNVVGMG